jgi:hypothetical protein
MSANATASTNVTVNGTLQSNLSQIIVTSATGLAPSMTVTGTGIQSNTTVTGISGTTITMNQVADIKVIGSAAVNFSATRHDTLNTVLVAAYTVNVSVGQVVQGPGLSPTAVVKVTNVVIDDPTGDDEDKRKHITLDHIIGTNQEGTYYFYTLAGQSAVSYVFKGPDTYKVSKPANGALPFGSFPSSGRMK